MNKNAPFNFFLRFSTTLWSIQFKRLWLVRLLKKFFHEIANWKKKKKEKSPKHTHNHSVTTTSSVHIQTRFKHTFWNWVQIWIVKKISHSTWWIAFLRQHPLMVIYKMHTIVRRGCNHSNGSLCDTNSLLQFHTVLIPVRLPDIINRTAVAELARLSLELGWVDASYPSCTLWARPTFNPGKIIDSCYRRVLSVIWINVLLLLLLPSRLKS